MTATYAIISDLAFNAALTLISECWLYPLRGAFLCRATMAISVQSVCTAPMVALVAVHI